MKFGELPIGKKFVTPSYLIKEAEIKDFSSKYDPQYIHLDKKKAEKGLFKGIIAPGLFTLSISWKLWIELNVIGDDAIGGIGMKRVRYLRPVYPGDKITVWSQIINIKEHATYKDRGYFTMTLKTFNQQELLVLKAELTGLVKR